MKKWFCYLTLIALVSIFYACSNSQAPSQPLAPDFGSDNLDYHFIRADKNRVILGVWNVVLDPLTGKIETTQLRTLDKHYNVTSLLTPPKCTTCFSLKNLTYDDVNKVVTIDVGFKNPSNLTGYDVRGIVTEFGNMIFLNPDGYTDLFSPVPGLKNPFLAYITGIGQREFPPLLQHFETMKIFNPNFPKFAQFQYVVDASWPDNCKEPYELSLWDISGNLFSDGSNTQQLRLVARDWQNNVAGVSVDLTPLGKGIVSLTADGSLPDLWKGNISCKPGTLTGEYKILAWATSGNPVDQIANMYNYIPIKVTEPAAPGVEVFNPPVRLTNSPGHSFIWPRHAVTVTDDGSVHAVWVDNSPDPYSNIYHVYYSKKTGSSWSTPKKLDVGNGMAVYATIAASPDNKIHVVWEDQRNHVLGSDIYYASSEDNFSTEKIIAAGSAGYRNFHPKITCGSDGTLHVVWNSRVSEGIGSYEAGVFYMKRSSGSLNWDSPVTIADEKGVFESYPSAVGAPGGKVYIAYQSNKIEPSVILFTNNLSGSFSTPVSVAEGRVFQPAMDVAPGGVIVIGYSDVITDKYSEIFVKTSTNNGQTWSPPQSVSGTSSTYYVSPDVVITDDADLHVAWHEEDSKGYPGRVFYREFVHGLGPQEIIEIVSGSNSGAFPSMAGDANGHIHMIYELLTPASPPFKDNYEIWYRNSVP